LKALVAAAFLLIGPRLFGAADAAPPGKRSNGPVKVFILAGQSNMQGHGSVRTLDWLGEDREYGHLLKKLKNADGSWASRPDVWAYYDRGEGPVKKGDLTVGFGVNDDNIGPELMFGNVMGDYLQNQVLLIKTAWGGRSLAMNFRPPGAGPPPLASYPQAERKRLEQAIADKKLTVGGDYQKMLDQVREVTGNLKNYFPDYDGRGCELAGFAWFQGWNDMIDPAFTAEYSRNLIQLVKDLRKDLNAPALPVVVAQMGVGGKEPDGHVAAFRKAQADAVAAPEFAGNVALVDTAQYWDETAAAVLHDGWKHDKWVSDELKARFDKMGSQPEYHYLGSGKIQALIGDGMGEAMKQLVKPK
jgi:alpha-galactosidase